MKQSVKKFWLVVGTDDVYIGRVFHRKEDAQRCLADRPKVFSAFKDAQVFEFSLADGKKVEV
jgi:hypothetical protein